MTHQTPIAAFPPRLPKSFRLDPAAGRLSLDPHDPTFYGDPYPLYAELHRRAPTVFWDELGCLAVCDHKEISALLRDRRFGRILPPDASGRPDYSATPPHLSNFYAIETHSLLDLEPPTHTRLRGLVMRAFVSRRIESLAPRIAALAGDLIDAFAEKGEVELVKAFAEPLPVIVIAELLGIDPACRRDLLDWSHAMVAMYQFGRSLAVEQAADRAAADFAAFMRRTMTEKARRPGDDLVSALIAAEADGGRLDVDEMVSTLILLMNAGHEATVHQIGNGVVSMLQAGVNGAALFDDDASGERTVEEILRFDTPLHLFKRVALEDVVLPSGHRMARGESVALLLAAGNRDPKVFQEPDRFDPQRSGPAPLSFGAGIHFCVGAALARLELRIALGALFHRLPTLALARPPSFRDSYHFRGVERLDLVFDRR